ncbi:MAG: hydantoinase/oxoprolinase family protein [Planctomycetes bacterium]|nr:hydantoinase/oxoprolinase family protein [Planctomycetota bacterium]
MTGLRIGIDTGGTFTDLAVLRGGALAVHKVPSTPDDPARAVLAGIARARQDGEHVDVVHGSTVGLNAILTGNLARTALVTNAGFEDLIEIGRQARAELYDLRAPKAVPPVPRSLRFGVAARRSAQGEELVRPSARELATLLRRLRRARVEAVAIGLLHSHCHPEDEARIAAALRPLGVPVVCSGELHPAAGEYERFTAAILDAAIAPSVGGYVRRLATLVRPGTLRLLRSSGGILAAAEAARHPARALFSGPAGGVLAADLVRRELRLPRMVALDMGGTSTDVSLLGEGGQRWTDPEVAGLPLVLPAVDVHSVGCGGGSLAYCDRGGALRVGPQSAGAEPGPACYGRGDDATITDAHVALGHLGPDTLLGGGFPIDPDRSVRAIERLARRLGMRTRAAAGGILAVATTHLVRALLVRTAQQAIDPASVPLLAFGGAGGLHAAALAGRLRMPFALLPPHPGAFSAIGLALAGESAEVQEPVDRIWEPRSARDLARRARRLRTAAAALLRRDTGRASLRVTIDAIARFAGQGGGLRIPFGPGLAARHAAEHRRLFGFVPEAMPLEIVALVARAEVPPRAFPRLLPSPAPSGAGTRRAPLGGAPWVRVARADLRPGQRLDGPLLIEEFSSLTLLRSGDGASVTRIGLRVVPRELAGHVRPRRRLP